MNRWIGTSPLVGGDTYSELATLSTSGNNLRCWERRSANPWGADVARKCGGGRRACTLIGRVGDQLPACQMILNVTGDLFTHGRQLKQLVFNDRIIGLLGKLPILGRLVPEIVRPIHAAQSNELGRDGGRLALS